MSYILDDVGILNWKPQPKQEEFLRVPDSIKEVFFGGAAGPGKSRALVMLPIVRGWHKHPLFHGILFRRTYKQLEESLIKICKEYYEPVGATYNSQTHAFTFPSGAQIRLSYLLRDEDVYGHKTAQYNYIGLDELTQFSEFQYVYLFSRLRTSTPDLPTVVRTASNPGEIGHAWVRKRFIEPAPFGGKIIEDEYGNTRLFIRALATDNPALLAANPDYLRQLEMLPQAEKAALLYGDWWSYAGQVFLEFRPRKYPDEPANALHVCDHFIPPSYWPKVISIDWGFSAYCAIYWSAIAPDGRIFFYREYVTRGTHINEWASTVRLFSQNDGNIAAIVIDPSAYKEEGHEKTIAAQFEEWSGYQAERAVNARVYGKENFHEYLRWKAKPPKVTPKEGYSEETYERILRMYGSERAGEYVKQFKSEPLEENLPKFQIVCNPDGSPSCPKLIETLQLCVYADNDGKGRKIEDVKPFDGDDPYDSARYNLMAAHRYVNDSRMKYANVQKLDSILALAAPGADQTEFYRAMERFDASHHSRTKSVKRFHRRAASFPSFN